MKCSLHTHITTRLYTGYIDMEKSNKRDVQIRDNEVGGQTPVPVNGVEQKKKRGWPKGKPRGPKRQKVETTEIVITAPGSSVEVRTPPPEEKKSVEIQRSKLDESRVSSEHTVRTLRNFILKRMHFMYKFKVKLEEMESEDPTKIDDAIAREALETMEAYLLKNLNRIRRYRTNISKQT